MPKTKTKAKATPKAKPKPVPLRHHRAPALLKKIKPRKAALPKRKPPQKARPIMTTQAAEPRGAGTGEHANATRGRKHDQSATEYAKGDIAKGKIDYEKLSEGQTAEQIAARDRRAYLIDQAEKNEAANDELNAIQTEQNKKVQFAQNFIQDPDEMREESMETALAALKSQDIDQRKSDSEAAQKAREKASPKSSPTSADFKQGQAAG